MNWNNHNRLPAPEAGEQALEHCDRLKIDIWKKEDGDVCACYEIHGSIGSLCDDDDEDDGGLAKEPTDLSLVFNLLRRMQQREGNTD